MAAPQPAAVGTNDLIVHVSGTSDITLPDGSLVRVPVGVSPESAASAILSASRSPYCVAPSSYAESLVAVRQNLDAVGRELAASRHAEASLTDKFVALDQEYNSLRLKFLAVDKENVALVARVRSLESELATARSDSDALGAEVGRLRAVLAKSDAVHTAEVKSLVDEVNCLKQEVCVHDARIATLEASVVSLKGDVVSLTAEKVPLTAENLSLKAEHVSLTAEHMSLTAEQVSLRAELVSLKAEVADLRARTTLSQLEVELCCAGELATKLEMKLVQHTWPGALSVGSPVPFLKDIRVFFDKYFDGHGRLGSGKTIPKGYHHAPPPMRRLLDGDADAFTETYVRWASLQTACPAFVDVIDELKMLCGGKIAHVQPPQASSPMSLWRALNVAHEQYVASEPAAGAGDERVARALECLVLLEALREWWPE